MTTYKAVLTLEVLTLERPQVNRARWVNRAHWRIYRLITTTDDLTEAIKIAKEMQFEVHSDEKSVSTDLHDIEDMDGKIVWSCYDE